jgi:DNA-binding NtrC family response regulator
VAVSSDAAVAPPRVLLVGPDRRFRAVAAALLTRRGCRVTVSDGAANVADLARREASDVVVLDGAPSLAFSRRQASQLKAADPPIGVVIVGEDQTDGAESGVIAKWGSFERLFGAIEDARIVPSAKSTKEERAPLVRQPL